MNNDFHAVRANVLINFSGDINQLADKLNNILNISIWFKHDIDYEKDIIGMAECMGFELWLHHYSNQQGFNFEISLESSLSFDAIANNRIYDMSSWLNKFLSDIGNLNTKKKSVE